MKKTLSTAVLLIAIIVFAFAKAKNAHPGPCGVPNIIQQLRLTPVIVLGQFMTQDSAQAAYKINVIEVIKGKNIPKVLDEVYIHMDSKDRVMYGNKNFAADQTPQLYYLSEINGRWQIVYGWCMPNQFWYRNGKVTCGDASISDFKSAVALFMQNYDDLMLKINAGKKVTAPKKVKSKAYRYLIMQLNYYKNTPARGF